MEQQRALAKASAEQESSSSASDSELKDASLYYEEIMIVQVELNAFEVMLESGETPNKIPTSCMPTTYRGDTDRTKSHRNNEMNLASQVTGKTLFGVWGLESPIDMDLQPLARP